MFIMGSSYRQEKVSKWTILKIWLYAERDLDSARFLMKMHPVPIEIICYH
jgi:hypothetical protein